MNQYYRVSIKIGFETKSGQMKYKKENYIIFDVSPSAIEAKLAKHLGVEDYEIVSISLINIVAVL